MPTRRGRALFGEGRWDPYMEDPGTLWLLHWLLLAPKKSRLPVWWLAFNEFNAVEFAEADLQAAVFTLLDAVPEWHKPHPNSINKDISALLRTYAPADRKGRARIDDMLDCPLRELNLLGRSPTTGRLRGQSESSSRASSAPAFAMPRSAACRSAFQGMCQRLWPWPKRASSRTAP